MARMVYCQHLKREAEGLDTPPHSGALGQRIFENISAEAWQRWLARLSTLISEYRLSTADPQAITFIETHMRAFLFGEPLELPPGFRPPGRKK